MLRVGLEDLKRVGAAYLKPENASVAVITNAPGVETLKQDPALADADLTVL